jgi:hypothetical protein
MWSDPMKVVNGQIATFLGTNKARAGQRAAPILEVGFMRKIEETVG